MRIAKDAASNTSTYTRWGLILLVAAVFVLAVELMKRSAHDLQPALATALPYLIDGDASALGASWLTSYIMVSGSVVAAISLTFFESALVSASELTLMLFGSRFGAAGVVLLVGLLDAAHEHTISLEEGSSMGLLTFLATFGIGIPAASIAWLWAAVRLDIIQSTVDSSLHASPAGPVRRLAGVVVEHIGPLPTFLLAIVLLIGALKLFDRSLEFFDLEVLTGRLAGVLANRWSAAIIGLGFTLLTTSVAFSVAALVPLFNRRVLDREQILPYLIGANVGTMGDTLLISVLLEKPEGVEVTLVVIGSLLVVSLLALATYERFRATIFYLEYKLTHRRSATITALVALVLVPLGLLATAWV